MPVDDSLLFIDANKYLDLYRMNNGRELLAPLAEQVDYIFVTQQVFSEVQRNKISVAAEFLKQKSKELKLQTFNLPDHLSSTSNNQRKDILDQTSEICKKIDKVNAEVDTLVSGLIEEISCSKDEVSKVLSSIFAKASVHSPEELQRARDRRELGNPPGKNTNPIGDQLTWEQILTHFKGKKRLWIISRDGDYGTVYGSKGFLNCFLYDELCRVVSEPEVYLFDNIVKGIRHFVDTTGVKAENCLTPEEVEEIEEQEKSLPSLTHMNEVYIQQLADFRKVNLELRQQLAELGNLELRQQLAELGKPSLELRQLLAELGKSNLELRQQLAELGKSNLELRQQLAELGKPNLKLRQQLAELGKPNSEEKTE